MRAPSPRKLVLLALLLLGLFVSAGCRFDVGSDYRVTVTWLINGTAPSRRLCEENGVDRVRFTVLSPGKQRTLEGDCDEQVILDSDGLYYGGFISTSSFDYDVRYRYRVEMVDVNGRPLEDLGYTNTFVVRYGDEEPWVLDPLELFSPTGRLAAVSGEWTIERRKANATDCERLGAKSVAIDFASSTDRYFDDPVEIVRADCSTGIVISDGAVLGEGEYNVRYVALDAENEIVQDVIADELYVVDKKGTLDIETVDFDL